MDSWVNEGEPNTNYGVDDKLVAGYWAATGPPVRSAALLRWDLSDIPEHACIANAVMQLTQVESKGSFLLPMLLEAPTARWWEKLVTWNNAPPVVGFGHTPQTISGHGGVQTWDITDLVQSWVLGERENFGLCLHSILPTAGLRVFGSRESSTPPRLTFQHFVDTTAPTNPTSITSSHTPFLWSNVKPITVTWSGASDGNGCAVYGYSYTWSTSPSPVPDETVDTTGNSDSFNAPEGFWNFGLRTRDRAGNWNPAVATFGPIRIDTTPPESAIQPLFYYHDQSPVLISWSGSDMLSGVKSYDVQYRDGSGPWIDWHVNVTTTSASFIGTTGHTYGFRCWARDAAGNVEAYPSTPDATIRIGRDTTVTVRDRAGNPLPGARVYRNNELLGLTAANGTILVPNCVTGDRFAALYQVYEMPSTKRPGDWAYRIYRTSITLDDQGNPSVSQVADLNFGPDLDLTVRWDQSLVGFHIVFSVHWDADQAYLDDLAAGAQRASDYIYDYTDGQFFWGQIDIFDFRASLKAADVRVLLKNTAWPCAHILGIVREPGKVIKVPRVFRRSASLSNSWTDRVAFGVLRHEFGHYGFGLYEEYLDAAGNPTTVGCATNRANVPLTHRSCVMFWEWIATELCSMVDPNHTHSTNTWQHAVLGKSCWDFVIQWYGDSSWPARWVITSPYARGNIVPGPEAIPMPGFGWKGHTVTWIWAFPTPVATSRSTAHTMATGCALPLPYSRSGQRSRRSPAARALLRSAALPRW